MMTQKDAVYAATVSAYEHITGSCWMDGEDLLSQDEIDKKDIKEMVKDSILDWIDHDDVYMSSGMQYKMQRDSKYIYGYVSGLINNWWKKDIRFSGKEYKRVSIRPKRSGISKRYNREPITKVSEHERLVKERDEAMIDMIPDGVRMKPFKIGIPMPDPVSVDTDGQPLSSLNGDGAVCTCGARHSIDPNVHMIWCKKKVWK